MASKLFQISPFSTSQFLTFPSLHSLDLHFAPIISSPTNLSPPIRIRRLGKAFKKNVSAEIYSDISLSDSCRLLRSPEPQISTSRFRGRRRQFRRPLQRFLCCSFFQFHLQGVFGVLDGGRHGQRPLLVEAFVSVVIVSEAFRLTIRRVSFLGFVLSCFVWVECIVQVCYAIAG